MDPNDSRMKIVEQSMELVDKETMMICPYNEVHVIRAKRFQYHLMKCRKNFAGSDMVTCPFNARHVIPRPEQRHHINTCPDRTLIEQDANYNTKRQSTNDYEGNISVPKYIQDRPRIWESGEDWDDDIQTDFDQYDYPSAGSAGNPNFYPQPQTNGYRVPQEAAAPQALRQPRRPPGSVGQPIQGPAHHPLAAGPTQPAAQQPAQPPTGAYQPPAATYQPPTSMPSWANIAGIGRGIQRTTPLVGSAAPGIGRGAAVGRGVPGVGRGVVPPPPGFGRGHRGPAIAANIYNNAAAPGT